MLEIRGLTVRYGQAVAVTDVSLEVNKGEWVALIGPNGAGKTSTIKAVLGLVSHEGHILLEGEPLDGLPAWARQGRGLGYVPEGRRLFADMSVEENLRVGAYRVPDRRVRENLSRIYEMFPVVGEKRRRPAKNLSGGEQQLVALGRALMSDPRYLLVDEASLGLMPLNVEAVFQALAEIHRQGSAILLVEQNAHKALEHAERACVLEVGRLQFSGSSEEIRNDPRVIESYLG
ncbi:MAG: ABC transporter ATP-binding protein [Syntrophobacteraceae bacterium]